MPRTKTYHLPLPHFNLDSSRDMKLLFAIRVLRSLVNKLAMFFLPLFLFHLGGRQPWLSQLDLDGFQKGVAAIASFYALARVVALFSGIPIGKAIIKLGYQRSLIVAHLFLAIELILLRQAEQQPALVLIVALIDGLQTNFFWHNYHTLLSKNALRDRMGQDLGVLQFFLNLVMMASPAIGGLVIVTLGYPSLFMIGLAGVVLGIGISALLSRRSIADRVSFREFLAWAREAQFIRLSFSAAGRYFNDAALALWPLYVFLILGSADRVGFLYSISLLLAMIISLLVGIKLDRHASKKPFFVSGGLLSLIWFIRANIFNAWSIALVDMFDKLTSSFHWLFYDRLFIRRGKGSRAFAYFVYREVMISISAIIFWTAFALLFIIWPLGWRGLFALAAAGVMLSLLVKETHE